MANILIALISLVAGIFASLAVSHYYYRRTVKKVLGIHVVFAAAVFEDLDADLRESLRIEYNGVALRELTDIRLLVTNRGERSIRDVIKPLRLHLPPDSRVLDIKVLFVHPQGREVAISASGTDEQAFCVIFPLLNGGDFFVLRILLDGAVSPFDLNFTITADDLPPAISPGTLPSEYYPRQPPSRDNFWRIASGALAFCISGLAGYTSFLLWRLPRLEEIKHPPMLGDPLGFSFSLTTMIAIVGSIASIWLIGGGFTWRLYSGRTAIPPGVDLFAREFSDQTGAATSTGARDDA